MPRDAGAPLRPGLRGARLLAVDGALQQKCPEPGRHPIGRGHVDALALAGLGARVVGARRVPEVSRRHPRRGLRFGHADCVHRGLFGIHRRRQCGESTGAVQGGLRAAAVPHVGDLPAVAHGGAQCGRRHRPRRAQARASQGRRQAAWRSQGLGERAARLPRPRHSTGRRLPSNRRVGGSQPGKPDDVLDDAAARRRRGCLRHHLAAAGPRGGAGGRTVGHDGVLGARKPRGQRPAHDAGSAPSAGPRDGRGPVAALRRRGARMRVSLPPRRRARARWIGRSLLEPPRAVCPRRRRSHHGHRTAPCALAGLCARPCESRVAEPPGRVVRAGARR
mmetsp:Transcript_20692/g.57745  ORF Transcript_20692/g.57745 Transcript_20692/m.57745 type:complete len:334 (-) Transcript_20692:105-1106(-)